jgi:hypothetical protein
MRKKQVTKKQAATGRPTYCSDCYVPYGVQLHMDGYQDYLCPRCGRVETGRPNGPSGVHETLQANDPPAPAPKP